ncbi:hypothetical protein [Laceyella sacchari]|uniref:Uncharacterized protein n=1 Tax=Laceyella sacchari TaxID=37482 RepID=A0ABY5U243_LACSH|nr:hypothetical protein [Laceyella sacchari]UWE03712.1 hypothetical protein NYR52_00355 [Laceyella sacchari]
MAHPERNFFAIHVTNAIDAIDYDRAVIKKLSTGLRLEFEKYAFVKEKVERENILRLLTNCLERQGQQPFLSNQ